MRKPKVVAYVIDGDQRFRYAYYGDRPVSEYLDALREQFPGCRIEVEA
jgi:hypothetical protein